MHPTGTITKSDLNKDYLPFREIYKAIIPAHYQILKLYTIRIANHLQQIP
ncbi:hypothetical protein SPHINGO8BC_150157 [Sphingobacterium multivorum]|uniref:Uncharacterized protein n=1 Tax=Sphingobacterium multivorum TaxID=28454 RepID=A0A654A2A2_SPHMU|nr:hypothetical protein SPHINGO8BC_150157 [Sphingobacterium multivorum]